MSKIEVDELVRSQHICRIAFMGEEYPYIAPFQYVLMKGSLYFHFTDYGRKMRYLERNNRVCVQIEHLAPDLSDYKFVVIRGTLDVVKNEDERNEAIQRMAQEGEKKLSRNFLAAHGLGKEEGWSELAGHKNATVVRLADVTEEMGLKSP